MIELDFWDTLITVPFLLIGLSPAWFAFTKSTRVRWMLAIGWWAFGFLFVYCPKVLAAYTPLVGPLQFHQPLQAS